MLIHLSSPSKQTIRVAPCSSITAPTTVQSEEYRESPAAPTLPPPPPPLHERYYQFQAARTLPQLDCFRDVADTLLTASWRTRYKRTLVRCRLLIAAGIILGTPITAGFLFLELRVARMVAILVTPVLAPSVLVAFLSLRIEMLALQARTYEFWYTTWSILVGVGLVAASLDDARSILVLTSILGYENILCLDAYVRVQRSAAAMSMTAAVGASAVTFAIALGQLPSTRVIHVVAYRGWTLQASDIIMNTTTTIFVVLLRNAYRIRAAALAAAASIDLSVASSSSMLALTRRCFTFRVPIQLVDNRNRRAAISSMSDVSCRAITAMSPPPTEKCPTSTTVYPDQNSTPNERLAQMRYVNPCVIVDAREVLFRCCSCWWSSQSSSSSSSSSPSRRSRVLSKTLFSLGGTSVLLMTLSRIFSTDVWLTRLALATSIAYILPSMALYNRMLLYSLLSSFDFLFLSVQQWGLHITMCVLLEWDEKSALPLANALWMQWLITIDALTPPTRQLLGLRHVHRQRSILLIAVAVFHLYDQLALFAQLVLLRNRWGDVTDGALATFTLPSGSTVTFRAIPFLLTRMLTVFPWTCRLLVRLLSTQHANELVMLQGAVEYDDQRWKHHLLKANQRRTTRATHRIKPKSTNILAPS